MTKKSRRGFLLGLFGGLGALFAGLWLSRRSILEKTVSLADNFDPDLLTKAPTNKEDYCVLTTSQVEGPYFFPAPVRKNIREDREGQALELQFQILRHPDCTPIEGAIVELWHCDAEGVYSGYPAEISKDSWESIQFLRKNGTRKNGERHVDPVNDNRFLRGQQTSDANGWVAFDTIVPGWYAGRVPHIHAKIWINETESLTTQFYLDPELSDGIYEEQAPYNKYGKSPLRFEQDIVLGAKEEANGLLLNIQQEANANQPLKAIAKIGIVRV